MKSTLSPDQIALIANKRRRATMLKIEKRLLELAKLPQPVTVAQVSSRIHCPPTCVGRELSRFSLAPWFRAETVSGGRYLITVDQALKNLVDGYLPGICLESPVEFHKRLQREIAARRKEVEVRSHGAWVPDEISKMGLIRILNWIDAELFAFTNGHSVNARDGAVPMPQMGNEENNGQENQVRISTTNEGTGIAVCADDAAAG
jgi:hypothetical protein